MAQRTTETFPSSDIWYLVSGIHIHHLPRLTLLALRPMLPYPDHAARSDHPR